MAIIQDWKIRSTQARCELTGEQFADGEVFFTCIFEDKESDGFLRRDYSNAAWQEVRKTLSPQPYSFWKSTYKMPAGESGNEEEANLSIEAMLRRFIDEDDPATENARYVLALMLERDRTLIPTDSKETETRTLLFYEHADNGDVFIVTDPKLRLDEIETVQREVSDLLAAEEERLQNLASEKSLEAPQEEGHGDEEQSEQESEESPQAEEEAIPLASEEATQGIGTDPSVDSGEELPNKIDEELGRPEDHK